MEMAFVSGQGMVCLFHTRLSNGLWTAGRLKGVDFQPAAFQDLQRTGPGVRMHKGGGEVKRLLKEGRLGKALDLLEQQGIVLPEQLYVSLLHACMRKKDLANVKRLHAHLAGNRVEIKGDLAERLVSALIKYGSVGDGLSLFHRLPRRSVFSWTAVIVGLGKGGQLQEAVEMYWQMQEEGVKPNKHTFISLLKACGSMADLKLGKCMHAEVIRHECELDLFVGTALLDMYVKCRSMVDARHVFDMMPRRDVVSWTVMMAGYAEEGEGEMVLWLYAQMQEEGVKSDDWTFVSVIKACARLAEEEEGVVVDGECVKVESLQKGRAVAAHRGCVSDVFVGSSLVHLYAKCGSIVDARQMFDGLPERNVVLWNAMIGGYVQRDRGGAEAWQLYGRMQETGVKADEVTFFHMLKACSSVGALNMCRLIECDVMDCGYGGSMRVATALIHAYGECGAMVNARKVFDAMPVRDVAVWNALLSGFARRGDYGMSVLCFEGMCQAGMQPTGVTFLSLLSACNHAGMVEAGLEYFERMTRVYGVCADTEHYAIVAQILGRAGLLNRAADLLLGMPLQPDFHVWSSLLGACRNHGDVELGRHAFERSVQLSPKHSATYATMSDMYALAGMSDCAMEIDELRRRAGAWPKPGQTWIEHKQQVHTFLVGDRRHSHCEQVHGLVRRLSAQLQDHPGLSL